MPSGEAAAFASPRGGSLRISGFVGEPSAGRMPRRTRPGPRSALRRKEVGWPPGGLVAYAEDACKYDKCINIGSIFSINQKPLCGFENRSGNVGSTFTNCLNCGSLSGGSNSFGFAKGGNYTLLCS